MAITVSDLGMSKELDREAMTSVRGGLNVRKAFLDNSTLTESYKRIDTDITKKNHQDVWAKQEVYGLFGGYAEGAMVISQSNEQ